MHSAGQLFIAYSMSKLEQLTERIESCLDRLSDGQIWARGGENENAVGNLTLHLCGNVGQWIVAGVGGAPRARDRDSEFSARGGPSSGELKRRLRETVAQARTILEGLPEERLTERVAIQGYDVAVLEAVYHVVEHFSMHAGQILFAAKMLTGADLGFYARLGATAPQSPTAP